MDGGAYTRARVLIMYISEDQECRRRERERARQSRASSPGVSVCVRSAVTMRNSTATYAEIRVAPASGVYCHVSVAHPMYVGRGT